MFIFKNINKILLICAFTITINAQMQSLKVGNVLPGNIDMGGFNVSEKSRIEIEGLAASFDQWHNYLNYYAWILKSDTRDLIWKTSMCEDYEKEDGEFAVNSKVEFDEGNYEVYFAAGYDLKEFEFTDLNNLMGNIFKKKKEYVGEFRDKFFISLSGDEHFQIFDPEELVLKRNRNAIVSITHVGDFQNITRKFSLSADTKVHIYGLGEGIRKQFYDFGYIYDVTKNQRVWMFDKSNSRPAGGGEKNQKVESYITLQKGSYYVTYITDDSHSFDEWNVLPPDDPQYWGITIFPASEKDAKNVIPFRDEDVNQPIVEISKVNDNQSLTQGFSLEKDLSVRILSVGEGYNEMVDYGWILNADTREIVWKMRKRNTEYAGGAKKNRMIDELIKLKKGNYIAHYTTDDSHSYMNWNDTPPYHGEDWGIKIWTTNKGDNGFVKLFDAKKFKNENLLVKITRVENEELASKSFTLSSQSRIRVIAIGEGEANEMYDYGWIENNSGDVVWEMKYRSTYHAGGAKKNRIFNDTIELASGEYKVYYKSDDSHSYSDWNSDPPDDQEDYGISLIMEK